jgi:hypothetical protein
MTYDYDSTGVAALALDAIVAVESGQVWQVQAFISGGATEISEAAYAGFWIRGYTARG